MRRYRPAQRALEAARKRCARLKDTTFTLRVALLEARVRSIRGQVKGTRLLADWIQRRSPGHRYADDALFLHAEVLQRRGDTKGAHAAYERLIRQFPDADFGPTARWRLALAALLAGEKSAVRTHLDQILKDSSARPAERHRAQYWRARLALDAKDEAAAKAGFERLVLDPNFYGWLALDRLATQKP
ncbi:unnamed protein product, partial [Laminaria digitata]